MNSISTTSGRVSKNPVLYADIQDVSDLFSVQHKQKRVANKIQKSNLKQIQDDHLLFIR